MGLGDDDQRERPVREGGGSSGNRAVPIATDCNDAGQVLDQRSQIADLG